MLFSKFENRNISPNQPYVPQATPHDKYDLAY